MALVATSGGVVVSGVAGREVKPNVWLGVPAVPVFEAVTVSTDTMVLTPNSDEEADDSLANAELKAPVGIA